MKHFNITFTCTEDKLATLISLLSGECLHLTVAEVARTSTPRTPSKGGSASVNRAAWAAKYAGKLLSAMEPNRDYTIHAPELHKLFEGTLQAASVGSLLSLCANEGRLVRTAPGTYRKA